MKLSHLRSLLLSSGVLMVFLGVLHPALADAAAAAKGADQLGFYFQLVIKFIDVYIVPFIFALAFLVFIWGIFQYFIAGATSEEKRDNGKQLMIWGLLGFFVMISVWGIVNLLVNTLGFGSSARPSLPTFGPSSSQTTSGTNNNNVLDNIKPDAPAPAQTTPQPAQQFGPNGCPIYGGVEVCT